MGERPLVKITLTEEMHKWAKELVKQGYFRSVGEVVEIALRNLKEKKEKDLEEIAAALEWMQNKIKQPDS